MLRTLLLLVVFFLVGGNLMAQSSEELRRQQAEIQKEIEELKQSLKATQKNKKASIGQLALVQKKIRLREQAIHNINDQINVIQGTINQSRSEIGKLKKELDTLRSQYEKSVVYAYKNRSNYDFLNFVFSSASFNDALKRVEYLKTYRNFRQQQADAIRNTQTMLQQKIAGLEVTRKQKDEVLQKQEKEKIALVDERKEKDDVVKKLKEREKEINKELTAKAKTDRKIRDGIAAAIKREMDKARAAAAKKEEVNTAKNTNTTTTTTTAPARPVRPKSVLESTPEGIIVSEDFEKNKGKLPWPVEKGNIKIHFGPYKIEGTTVVGNNPGLTIETDPGAAVKSIFDGVVTAIFDVDGSTNILVQHGKYFTTYGNLSGASVNKGQKVNAGQTIGRASANSDGNGEFEFVLLQESRNLNPEVWIRRK